MKIDLMTAAILVLNFGISWWNCYAVGGMWVESKALGGFPRLLAWSGAIMAACGFSSVFVFLLLGLAIGIWPMLAGEGVPFPPEAIKFVMSFWYVVVILPILGSGIVITIHGWIEWWRDRSMLQLGVNAWNTYAMAQNTVSAIQNFGPALGNVMGGFGELMKPSSDDDGKAMLVKLGLVLGIIVVVGSLAGGAILTAVLIKKYAGRLPLPIREDASVPLTRAARA